MTHSDPCPRHLYALCRQRDGDRSYMIFQNSPERGIARAGFFPHNMPRAEKIIVVQVDEYPDGHRKARDKEVDPHQWYGADWIRWVWAYFAQPDGGRSPVLWKRCDPPEWAEEWFSENPPQNEVQA